MSYLVGAKGQVVISKEIRDRVGIEPGWRTYQYLVDGHVEIHFLPPSKNQNLRGSLVPFIKRQISEEEWPAAREEAWAAAAHDWAMRHGIVDK
jgi:bifunctional DNA-binding transcriptional regulator/antitoxin component of YhaV-PrlF toxin-antitoxin module